MRFHHQKYEKNWKSKNGVKTALTPLFKELWAIYVFFTNLKFDDCQKHQRKPAKVQKSWRIEFQPRKGSKIWKNWKSKNDFKSRLRALNNALWAIYVFFQTWNLTITKNTIVTKEKSKHYEEFNFNRGKIQKM